MSIAHHLHATYFLLTPISFIRAGTRLFLSLLLSMVLCNSALAAEENVLGLGDGETSTRVLIPDSFGRDTPRTTVQGFISALSANDDLLASNYLNLSTSDNPTTTVRQFKQALDAGGQFFA